MRSFSDRSAAIYALGITTPLHPLSRRQVEVAWLVADGLTDKQIAHTLGVQPRSIPSFIARITTKLRLNRDRNLRVQITRLVVSAWHEVEEKVA